MPAAPPLPAELDALLRLLDDETPAVREQVAARLALFGGDISESLTVHPRVLTAHEKTILIEMLRPPRRETLIREWLAPTGGASALQEDWESFEALLCTLSDYLHDGISLRQSLSDALDLLAEEASEAGVTTSLELRKFLFKEDRFTANKEDYHDPRNSDLAWSIAEGRSNPIGLSLIFILVGSRLGLEIHGVSYPGHFMCRIFEEGHPIIIDCFDGGQLHLQSTLLESPQLSSHQRKLLRQSCDLGSIIQRLLNNLRDSFEKMDRHEDAALVSKLQATLA